MYHRLARHYTSVLISRMAFKGVLVVSKDNGTYRHALDGWSIVLYFSSALVIAFVILHIMTLLVDLRYLRRCVLNQLMTRSICIPEYKFWSTVNRIFYPKGSEIALLMERNASMSYAPIKPARIYTFNIYDPLDWLWQTLWKSILPITGQFQ